MVESGQSAVGRRSREPDVRSGGREVGPTAGLGWKSVWRLAGNGGTGFYRSFISRVWVPKRCLGELRAIRLRSFKADDC